MPTRFALAFALSSVLAAGCDNQSGSCQYRQDWTSAVVEEVAIEYSQHISVPDSGSSVTTNMAAGAVVGKALGVSGTTGAIAGALLTSSGGSRPATVTNEIKACRLRLNVGNPEGGQPDIVVYAGQSSDVRRAYFDRCIIARSGDRLSVRASRSCADGKATRPSYELYLRGADHFADVY